MAIAIDPISFRGYHLRPNRSLIPATNRCGEPPGDGLILKLADDRHGRRTIDLYPRCRFRFLPIAAGTDPRVRASPLLSQPTGLQAQARGTAPGHADRPLQGRGYRPAVEPAGSV